MLNKNEEGRLDLILSLLRADLKKDPEMYADEYKVKGLLWVAEKLKETQKELSQVHLELRDSNRECDRLREGYDV